ncbi:hypothetical protein L3X38_030865 [Prunus dulcis]|uniref:DUF674 family protein n=1 Tax=Prunus dulcis TaxID=3755 RepID=A0AAD4VB09_PRUDU|nr:hypothetical protein L3X38_030865 [Prunus dulcis]
MADESLNNISLKALVNKGSNRVIFIESGHEFIDVLISFLTLPMGTIIKLARNHSAPLGIGCMKNLYASVKDIDVQHFRTNCWDMLLCPRNGAGPIVENLEMNIDDCDNTRFFRCSNVPCWTPTRLSYYNTVPCRCGNLMNIAVDVYAKAGHEVFVKGPVRLIISDDLQVLPPETSVSSSLLKKAGAMDSNTIEELSLDIGADEVFNLLMCSFVSKTPLTDIFLKRRPRSMFNKNIGTQQISINSRMIEEARNMYSEANEIFVKLIVSKSKNVVCYAEAGEDFVNLLFSFLMLPLGFILKAARDVSLKGCIDRLYKSVKNLDGRLWKSDTRKELVVRPKPSPGFCYQNHPLGIEEASNVLGDQAEIVDPLSQYYEDENEDSSLGFLKGPAMFMVTDSLVVSSISPILGLSVLNDMNVPITDVEVQTVHVGVEEAFGLLVASFGCESAALTSVFLRR